MNYSHTLQCGNVDGARISLSMQSQKKKKKKQVIECHCRRPTTSSHPDDFLVTPSDHKGPDAWYDSISMRKGEITYYLDIHIYVISYKHK